MSSQEEVRVTSFLAERLGTALGAKFYAEPENQQDSDTDTYIVVESGEKIPVQNVTSEGEFLKQSNYNTKILWSDKPLAGGVANHLEWVSSALAGKEKKQYSNAKGLVIALCGSMPTIPASQIKEMFKDIKSTFAGIYYISTPNSSSTGYVVALKKHWDTEDIF